MKKNTLLLLMLTALNAQLLNLNDCVSKALKTHPDIRNFALGVEYSAAGVNLARADYLQKLIPFQTKGYLLP